MQTLPHIKFRCTCICQRLEQHSHLFKCKEQPYMQITDTSTGINKYTDVYTDFWRRLVDWNCMNVWLYKHKTAKFVNISTYIPIYIYKYIYINESYTTAPHLLPDCDVKPCSHTIMLTYKFYVGCKYISAQMFTQAQQAHTQTQRTSRWAISTKQYA